MGVKVLVPGGEVHPAGDTKGRDAPWSRGSGPANPHKDTVIHGGGRGVSGAWGTPVGILGETHTLH